MPSRAQRPCTAPGCPNLVARGRCADHERQRHKAIDARRGTAHSRGYGVTWRKIRAYMLNREPLCRRCLDEGVTQAATDLDHIIPKAQGGTDDPANLQPLCHAHHSAKTMRESVHPGGGEKSGNGPGGTAARHARARPRNGCAARNEGGG